jgi:ABC-type uncharacterized transport system permease subunit
VFGLICVGLLGASLFTTGIIFSMTPMVAAGLVFLVLSIFGMLVHYVYCKQSLQQNLPAQIKTAVHYTSNNMNTMKRSKSDTDLELISRQTEAETFSV